ncbi:alpha-L-rhamnosidase-related protein [Faecalibacterium sp. An121]|uniref:alpha-L-rhamnosidase-related protein n=1 Tax=Faecalibacterium sp. An121 TaxID=1965550 RepID=UPI000B3B061D|nr:alpha-L-rhamnosidase C-terminal domain-containing protein [Faecalibacterium sp. An121]OUQ39256.1 hypothetical protein B5E66_05070 [Faecalibacterium sp. An121]
MTEGINVLAAMVLHYPQTVEGGNRSVWRMQHPAFAAAGQIEWEGDSLDWQTDESWQAAPAKDIRMHGSCPDTSRLVIQEEARGDASLQGWRLPGYDAAGWQSAAVYPKGAFLPTVSPAFQRKRSIPFLFEEKRPLHVFRAVQGDAAGWAALLEKSEPLTLPAHSEAVVELAAGRLMTAYLTLRVQGGRGSVIQWMPAEGYVQPRDGGASKGDRLDWQHGVLTGPTDRYEVGGFGAADDRLARQAIDSFARSQRADGLLNACYPAYKPNVIPGFSIYYILMLHDHMMYFGDKDLVERYFPVAERILQFYEDLREPDGLVGRMPGAGGFGGGYWCFVDWAKGWPVGVPPAAACGPAAIDSLMYCLGLGAAAELAEFVGRQDQAAACRSRAEALRCAVRSRCAGRDGLLQDGPGLEQYSQHVQVFGVLTGTLTGQKARAALEQTLDDPDIPQCTVAMGFYLFRALEQCGLYHRTFRLWDKWRRMLDNHLTTCVESDGSYTRSDCHGWGALALHELPSAILGVRPAKPGYASAAFKPAAGAWTHAAGEVVTPRGIIRAQWDVADGKLTKNIRLPEGMVLAEETDDF